MGLTPDRRRAATVATGFALGALLAAGCTTELGTFTAKSDANSVETQLRNAGFHIVPADTPARIEAMHAMRPLAFSEVVSGPVPYYVYPDPVSCLCLWVGSPAQYQHFRQLMREAEMGAELSVVQDFESAVNLWDPEWGTIDDPSDAVLDPDRP